MVMVELLVLRPHRGRGATWLTSVGWCFLGHTQGVPRSKVPPYDSGTMPDALHIYRGAESVDLPLGFRV